MRVYSYVDEESYLKNLVIALDYVDLDLQQAFLDTCTIKVPHMVLQEWNVTDDGKLYLENQDNNSIAYFCNASPEIRRLFRGTARRLWCYFLLRGLEEGVFTPKTMIRLEVRGNLAYLEKNVDIGLKRLEGFYKELGFIEVDRVKMWNTPLMEASVGTVMPAVCRKISSGDQEAILRA